MPIACTRPMPRGWNLSPFTPSPITLRGRFVVPSGQPSRRPLTVSFLGRSRGFSGLVRTLKRTLLLFFYDLCRRIRYSTRHFRLTARLVHARHDAQRSAGCATRPLGRTSVAFIALGTSRTGLHRGSSDSGSSLCHHASGHQSPLQEIKKKSDKILRSDILIRARDFGFRQSQTANMTIDPPNLHVQQQRPPPA